jgi:hypothetical protein
VRDQQNLAAAGALDRRDEVIADRRRFRRNRADFRETGVQQLAREQRTELVQPFRIAGT